MGKLLLAEHGYQVQDLVRLGFRDNDQWIALGPSAMAHLEEKGIKYRIPEDFYAPKTLQSLCVEIHQRVEALCDRLDETLFLEQPFLKDLGMRPFLFHLKGLMLLIDSVMSRMFQWSAVLRAFPTDMPVIHRGPAHPWSAFGLGFSNQETLWGHVAALPGWKARVEILPEPVTEETVPAETMVKRAMDVTGIVKRAALKSVFLTSAVRSYTAHDYGGLIDLVSSAGKGSALLIGAEYDWKYVIPQLRKEGWPVLFAREEQFKDNETNPECLTDAGLSSIEGNSYLMECFQLSGVSCYPLVRDRIAWIFYHAPLQFKYAFHKTQEVCNNYKVRAVLRTASPTGLGHAINQSVRNLLIPVFVWQHGAVMDNEPITQFYDYDDRMTADVTFVYGEGCERAYTECSRDFKSKVVPVGSASLDAVQAERKKKVLKTPGATARDGGIRILYATTNYYENHWYYGAPPGISDRYFYRDQMEIMNGLREAAERYNARVVIKLHPGREYMAPPWVMKFENYPGIRIVKKEENFIQLMYASDVVVLDYPSTTLLQSLAAGLPVFVLMKYWDYPAEARSMLNLRAVLADEPMKLIEQLRSYIEGHKYTPNLEDSSFFKAYGTYIGDGKSVDRVVKVLLN